MLTNGRVIHPTAVVSPKAELGEGVVIGPYCVIEDDAIISDGCILEAYVVVKKYTRMGCFNHIYPGTVLGGEPHDRYWERQFDHGLLPHWAQLYLGRPDFNCQLLRHKRARCH